MITEISNYLKTLLTNNTLVQKVYAYEREDPEGTPFATVTMSGNENDYNTTSENLRTYGMLIRLFIKRSGKAEATESQMATLVDSVLDDLDKNWKMSGITAPTGYTVLCMLSAPSKWAYYVREDEYRVAEINVKIMTSVDVNLIS